VWPVIPGALAYIATYLWVSIRGTFDWAIVDSYYQSLGSEVLSAEPAKSLLALHIQPPGLNALYAVVLAIPGEPETYLQATFFLAGLLTIVFVVMALLLLRVSNVIAMVAGVVMGAVPSTVLYALWPYNTTLIALFVSAALFGMALSRTRVVLGSSVFVVSVVAIFFTRPSLVWLIAVAAVFLPVLLGPKQARKKLALVSIAGASLILSLQAYHLVAFGSWSTSSWTGQSVVKGLIWSGQVTADDVRIAAGNDPCLLSLAKELEFWGSLEQVHPECFEYRSVPFGDALALKDGIKDGTGSVQLNSLRHLEIAPAWRSLALELVKAHPLAFPQMVLGVGPGQTSLEMTLLPGYQFHPLNDNLVAGTPILSVSRPLGVLLPVGGLTLILVLGVGIIAARRNQWPEFATFITAGLFTIHGLVTSVVPEFGENNRFFVEVYPALIVGSAIAVSVVYRALKNDVLWNKGVSSSAD
jgi:hypothetical protein